MSKSESEQERPKKERRFSQEQYEMLKRCSKKRDMAEWNEWRKDNPDEDILLEGADLRYTNLIGTNLQYAHLNKADLEKANLEGADLRHAHLEGANLSFANMKRAYIAAGHLAGAWLSEANLDGAKLSWVYLEGAWLNGTYLRSAVLATAVVNGSTFIWGCKINKDTDFRGVGLDSCRIDAGTKQLLKYNIRRMNWEDWYGKGRWWVRFLKSVFIKPFWWMSDYGMSTVRVVGVFFLLAFLFAAVYMNCAYWAPPGIVHDLSVEPGVGEAAWHYFLRAVVRPVYFSIVTMTTLGFGDMYANKGSISGHVILAVQVILGYVLLGALITRFAVLFTAGGPAGKFAESGKDKEKF